MTSSSNELLRVEGPAPARPRPQGRRRLHPGGRRDPRSRPAIAPAEAEKLSKAIEIIGTRINGLGVAEPIIRPVGTNRIEIQLPGVSTKDNPEVLDAGQEARPPRFPDRAPDAHAGRRSWRRPRATRSRLLDWEAARARTFVEELVRQAHPGNDRREASPSRFARPDLYGKPEVILKFTSDGRKKRFAEVTRAIADGRPARRPRWAASPSSSTASSTPPRRSSEEINSDSAQISGATSPTARPSISPTSSTTPSTSSCASRSSTRSAPRSRPTPSSAVRTRLRSSAPRWSPRS
jgi:preprotein translocase subunit SecD